MGEEDSRPVILIVEDSERWQERYREILCRAFEGNFLVIEAYREDTARLYFEKYRERLALVIMDACLNQLGIPDTYDLTRSLRSSGYTGPMIALSSDTAFNAQLVQAGCSHQMEKTPPVVRPGLPALIRELGLAS